MEHHLEADEKLIARNKRKEPANPRPVSEAGLLVSTLPPTSPKSTSMRMNVMIQEYFS